VSFDSYVIPETVLESHSLKRKPQFNGMVASVSVIAVLTFLLGVLGTLQFVGPRQVTMTAAVPEQTAPVPLSQAVSASLEQTVTRQQAPDLLTPAAAGVTTPQVPQLQAAVLAGLQPQRTVGKLTKDEMVQKAIEAEAMVSRNKMRMLREGVLAGTYTVTAKEENGKKRLVLTTINAEMSRESIGNLLLKAAKEGRIEIPSSHNTADGQIDLDTLLFNLIQTSLATDGTPEGKEAAREMSRRAFAASDAKTQQVRGERIYLVAPGDSLAYISLQFYGRPSAYLRIFEANQEQLKSPDLIQIGQRLRIPG
jgi:hypothetical protein